MHDKGEKTVLGVRIPAGGGRDDAEKVLDILAAHPSTAHFISRKLAQRFVADDPPPKLIDKMAKTFRDKNGDIREVMKTMLTSDEFFSQAAYRAKVKSPFEMIVSAVRATGAQVDFAFPLANQIAQLGEPLYRKLEPTGYSSANAEWVSSSALLARMNFALALAQNRVPGVKVDASKFDGEPGEVARQVLFTDAKPETQAAIQKALTDQASAEKPLGRAAEPGDDGGPGHWLAGFSEEVSVNTRRLFLKSSGWAMFGLGAAPLWLARAADAPSPRKKVLVAIFQRGAVDGLNVVVPFAEKNATTRCAPRSRSPA